MIVATQVVFSLVIALTLSITFGLILHKEVPRSGFLIFFLMIFLFTLVGGLWFQPFGPAHWGGVWVPMVVGLAGAPLLQALYPAWFMLQLRQQIRACSEGRKK